MCQPPHEEFSFFYVCTLDITAIDKTVTSKKCYILSYAIMFVLTLTAKKKKP